MEIASELNIKYIETNVNLEDLYQANEAFLTNSVLEIMPLVSVDDKAIGTGQPGVISGKILERFREKVNHECG